MNNERRTTNDSKRGAALILVLGFLSLITVMAVTFATMMRFEEKSSRNSLYQIQARQLAGAAFQYAIGVLKKDLTDDQSGITSPPSMYDAADEGWVTGFSGSAIDLDSSGSAESKWIYVHQNSNGTGPVIGRYAVLIQDEAGKMNLNVAGPGTQSGNSNQNEGWSGFELDLQDLPGIGASLAANIVNYREGINLVPGADTSQTNLGDDNKNNTALERDGIDNDTDATTDETNEGIDSPAELDPEIPYQDDHPFTSLEELTKVSGIGSSTLNSLKPYTTVSSYDTNQYWNGSSWVRKTNINHLLSTAQLYNLINASSAAERYRVSANMIDWADRDTYPTFTTSNTAGPSSTNSYMGTEGLQFNEIKTRASTLTRENTQNGPGTGNDVVRSGGWTFQTLGSSTDDNGDEGQIGNWTWPWDNDSGSGTYNITIYAYTSELVASISYNIEGRTGSITPPTTSVTESNVTITSGQINLQLTAAQDAATPANSSYFNKIELNAGKFVEVINVSQRDITFDTSSTNSWKLNLHGLLSFPVADGLPAIASGGTFISFSSAWYKPTTPTLSAANLATDTYNYLVIADSVYALDALYGDNNGSWGNTSTEGGKIIATNTLKSILLDIGADLSLTDYTNNLIAYIPYASVLWNVAPAGSSATSNQSRYRFSPIQQTSSPTNWFDSTTTSTPGLNNQAYSFTGDPSVKDRPFASLGELGDVFLGTDNTHSTYDVELYGSTFFDKITLAAKRLEAEDAESLNSWTTDTSTGIDGTTRYVAPNNSSTWNWEWSFNILNSAHITKPFRFRNSQVFDTLVYGQFPYHFQSPSGTTRYVRPNGSTTMNSTTASGNNVSLSITGPGGSNPNPKLDHIVLTPDPYTWGRVNINTASSHVLRGLKGITSTIASNMISYRGSNPFNSIHEVFSVSGISEDDGKFKPVSNLITVRSDLFRVIIRAEKIVDVDGDGVEGESSDLYPATVDFEAVVDRNPSLRFPGTVDRYRVEEQKYKYQ